jgi:uncharacterized protein YjbI with pentapeptide repeats
MVILTRDAIIQTKPCSDGMAAWDEYLAGGDAHATGGWSRDVQILALLHTPLRRYLGWAWRGGLLPMWSMSSANLSEANLQGADLSQANLQGADLSGADLHAANLSEANLSEADLIGADLRGANLIGADLSGVNLSGANLRWANLSEADLREADLREAALRGASLRGANLREANLREANLRGAGLIGANLSETNLIGANLRGADLRGANLPDGWRDDADCTGVLGMTPEDYYAPVRPDIHRQAVARAEAAEARVRELEARCLDVGRSARRVWRRMAQAQSDATRRRPACGSWRQLEGAT